MQDVFVEAGLSAGCVYNYFRSKDELMLAIAAERHEDERRLLQKLWKPDIDSDAHFAVFEHFLRSLETG